MSSTNRGSKRSPADFYSTSPWVVHRLLERLELPGGTWLESSAGEGGIIKAVNAVRKDVMWDAHELREECRVPLSKINGVYEHIGSFLEIEASAQYSHKVCLNNVPFSIAQEMIEHTLKFAPHVIHLLRLNYLGTEKRNEFFKNNMPDIYVIPDRVSFAISVKCVSLTLNCNYAVMLPLDATPLRKCPNCGSPTNVSSTDSIEYAWYHWGPERGRSEGKIRVLDHTPVEQRR